MSGLTVDRRGALALGLGGAVALALPAWAQDAAPADLDAAVDAIVSNFMKAFETPGIGVAIVRKGQVPWLRGYGVRTMGKPDPVDVHTRFGIASNSKAFTAAALALLVEEGKLGWDDVLTRHLPEFKMHDPAVTAMFTVRDLLVHRSGLPLGAGDLMYFPQSTADTVQVMRGLQFLRPVRGFRTGYDYDNILYIVAGILIERISGRSWRAFVSERLLAPLGMIDAVPSRELLKSDNVAGRHARLGPPVRGIGPMQPVKPDEAPLIDPGGGINASLADIAKWLEVQLALGELPGGKRLWSAETAAEMWKPQVIMSSSDGATDLNPARPVMQGYALGWMVQDFRGRRLISHSGGLSGQVTQTAMIPSAGLGVAVFSNTEDSVSGGIRNAILDHLLGTAPVYDWVASYVARNKQAQDEALAEVSAGEAKPPEGKPSLPLSAYAGRYRDAWYGDIVVTAKGGGLHIKFVPTRAFRSVLEPWGTDSFRTRFPAGAGEDAVVTFAVAGGKVTGVRMKALSPLADFSYDFHHLDFVPVR
ncbi:serine hydrolase [Sphingomonas sp. BT-65]|uniref:serine hydrolase n=1 Tax=Sphingomonas sp. BT-65 TaxID=2989821 RepID=UPI002235FF6A|nr:serine hydrolase [Sphingomonas sp. BT-65]MCW4461941.1 serine hydrolase [Sphingomonas sp. BT-65]